MLLRLLIATRKTAVSSLTTATSIFASLPYYYYYVSISSRPCTSGIASALDDHHATAWPHYYGPRSWQQCNRSLTTTTASSFDLKKSVELPSFSESEIIFIHKLWKKYPIISSPTNDNDNVPLWHPVQITNALLLLRSKLLLVSTRESIMEGDKLQALFDRCFAKDQFVVERMDDDESKSNLLIDMLARDRVHPTVINDATATATTTTKKDENGTTTTTVLEQLRMDETKQVYGLMHRWSGIPCMLLRISLGPIIPSCLDQIFRGDTSHDNSTTPKQMRKNNNVATFFSITLLEHGLSGLGLGETFLHNVMEHLQHYHDVDTFVTLSPMPRFREWLLNDQHINETNLVDSEEQQLLQQHAYQYIVLAKDKRGLPYDPVARFHLSNGAQLYRINYHPSNLQDSYGYMVNYLYDRQRLQERKDAFPIQLAIHQELLLPAKCGLKENPLAS